MQSTVMMSLINKSLRRNVRFGGRMMSILKASALTGNPNLVDNSVFEKPPVDPVALLNSWIDSAIKHGVSEPMDFVLATTDKSLIPSTRVLLAKCVDHRGLVFGSTSRSLKGIQLSENTKAAANFWWRETMQQVCIAGSVVELSGTESDELFAERTKSARAIASLSNQSSAMVDEAELKRLVNAAVVDSAEVVRPSHWKGYALQIERIEFWLGSTDRFHKRLLYTRNDSGWSYVRLQP